MGTSLGLAALRRYAAPRRQVSCYHLQRLITSACYKGHGYELRPCSTSKICTTKASSFMLSLTTRSTSACYKGHVHQVRPCSTSKICSTKASSFMLSPTTRSPALAIKNMCTILGLAGLRRCAALQGRASCYLLQRSPTFAITIMCTSLGLATLRRYAASNGQAHVITFNAFTSACYKQNLYQLRPCSTLKNAATSGQTSCYRLQRYHQRLR